MPVTSIGIPVELVEQAKGEATEVSPASPTPIAEEDSQEQKIIRYVLDWRNKLRRNRWEKRMIWDECWALYRGIDDFSDKQDWQSKIALPKAFGSVKQATSVIKRLLSTAKSPWNVESVNPDDMVTTLRAGQMTDLVKVLLENAHYQQEFAEGLECGFIIGVGVWKLWWGLCPRTRTRVENVSVATPPGAVGSNADSTTPAATDLLSGDPAGRETGILGQNGFALQNQDASLYPTQLPGEALDPRGWAGETGMTLAPQSFMAMQKQIVREEVLEGKLFMRAVDPYNFYWLPGSKLNAWTGTLEEIEVPKWQLLELAELGVLDKNDIKNIQPMRIAEDLKRSRLRFSEPQDPITNKDLDPVKILEYYGPLILDGEIVEKNAHILIANENKCLLPGGYRKNNLWIAKPPYVGFSPLSLPFRTEGVGLVEMVRKIDKALSQLVNLGMDTLVFRLLPLFEVNFDAFENPEDFETGMTPGKIFRRNATYQGPGIVPVQFQDVSGGAVQMAAALDREHQEGSLVSEIQQSMPRYRGVQSATEVETKNENQQSFFGAMAADIEKQALEPIVEMALDLILQFIDTVNDPRVASVLGVGADVLRGLTREQKMEMVNGDYIVKASGITGQLQKAEMLQNLVQFMNLIGQNPQAWVPYINQDALLRRILEAFRPAIHDLEGIIADPETALANKAAMSNEQITPQILEHMVSVLQMQQQAAMQERQMAMQEQQASMQQEQAAADRELSHKQMLLEAAKMEQSANNPAASTASKE